MQKLLKKGALFVPVGDGNSGAKFKSLRDGAEDSLAVGFKLKPRIEIRTGIFHEFFKKSGMLSAYNDGAQFSKIKELSERTPWDDGATALFSQISDEYNKQGEPVLMGRANSMKVDAGGNGTLLSGAILNTPGNIGKLMTQIALSFFSDKAREVRIKAGIADDALAAIVEPMVWERGGDTVCGYHTSPKTGFYEKDYGPMHAPRLSGYGKTETPIGGPRIGFVRDWLSSTWKSPQPGFLWIIRKRIRP